ncbi:MAG TPA: hypothetical protein PKY29_04440 [Ferruginibacter sp.]|nr:hypothetical protein [Ferruginibacter sp.]HRQ20537.1 hypothetical protein [Ferruginibacter sp.]
MARITLKEAIAELESGKWMPVRFITADVRNASGGKVIELPKARMETPRNAGNRSPQEKLNDTSKKSPNHHQWFTVNLVLPNRQIRKAHLPLITHVNNHTVI